MDFKSYVNTHALEIKLRNNRTNVALTANDVVVFVFTREISCAIAALSNFLLLPQAPLLTQHSKNYEFFVFLNILSLFSFIILWLLNFSFLSYFFFQTYIFKSKSHLFILLLTWHTKRFPLSYSTSRACCSSSSPRSLLGFSSTSREIGYEDAKLNFHFWVFWFEPVIVFSFSVAPAICWPFPLSPLRSCPCLRLIIRLIWQQAAGSWDNTVFAKVGLRA